jgi:hypothetical protein
VNDRLKSAIEVGKDVDESANQISTVVQLTKDNGIETTAEEMEGLYIVRAICASDIDQTRLVEKDTKTYFNILIDGNTWKSIARLHFNVFNKKVEIFDDAEPKFVELATVSELYSCSDRIRIALKKRLS